MHVNTTNNSPTDVVVAGEVRKEVGKVIDGTLVSLEKFSLLVVVNGILFFGFKNSPEHWDTNFRME